MHDHDAMRQFLRQRFPDLERGERIEIRALDRAKGGAIVARKFCTTPEEAAEYAAGLPVAWEIYYGINPRLGEDGTKKGVSRVGVAWADFDYKHYNNSPTEARQMLESFDLDPTWIVESGGGLHVYWLIEPLDAGAYGPVIERVLRALYARIGNKDAVQNIDRIFRLPGSFNNKYGKPRPVRVVQHDPAARYTLARLEATLPALPAATEEYGNGQPTKPGDLSVDEVRALLAHIPPTLPYSEYLAVWMAVHSLYPDDDGLALVDAWSTDARIAHGQYSNPRSQPNKHREFRRSGGAGAIGAGTLYHYARRHGWQPPARPFPMMKRRQRESEWRQELADLGEIDRAALPEFLARQLDYLADAVEPLPLDWSVQVALAYSSLGCDFLRFENLRPNLWFMGAAASNAGKNVVTDALNDLWAKVPMRNPLATFTTGTPEGMWSKLDGDNRKLLAYHREYAGYLQSFKRDYMSSARDALCNLYDGATVAHALAKKSILATDPYFVVIATTTPAGIAAHMQLDDLRSGYVNRYLTCAADAINLEVAERPSALVGAALARDLGHHLGKLHGVTTARWDVPRGEVPAAWVQLCRLLNVGTGEVYRFEDAVDEVRRATGRELARVKKAATVLETLEAAPQVDGQYLLIRERNLVLAILIVLRASAYMRGLESIVGVSADERLMAQIERHLRKKEQLSGAVLRNLCHADIRHFDTAIRTMIEDGRVVEKDPPEGHRASVFRLVG